MGRLTTPSSHDSPSHLGGGLNPSPAASCGGRCAGGAAAYLASCSRKRRLQRSWWRWHCAMACSGCSSGQRSPGRGFGAFLGAGHICHMRSSAAKTSQAVGSDQERCPGGELAGAVADAGGAEWWGLIPTTSMCRCMRADGEREPGPCCLRAISGSLLRIFFAPPFPQVRCGG
jgi:hypothetical protein